MKAVNSNRPGDCRPEIPFADVRRFIVFVHMPEATTEDSMIFAAVSTPNFYAVCARELCGYKSALHNRMISARAAVLRYSFDKTKNSSRYHINGYFPAHPILCSVNVQSAILSWARLQSQTK
jgi:hypothetical protein